MSASLILTPWLAGSFPVSSPFGAIRAGGRPHSGDDFPMPIGTLLRAPVGGVARAFNDAESGGGLSIVCDCNLLLPDGRRVTSWGFAHLSEVAVGTGSTPVLAGQIVGRSGNSGAHTSGPHLHFTIRIDGQRVAPSSLMSLAAPASAISGLLIIGGLAAAWLIRSRR
jgi:murein DD-endopeptidase MepM/ murein hydrolase activator NlpD